VRVRPGRVAPLLAMLVAALPVAAQDGVGFRAALAADTVYVGQQATYALTVTVPPEVRQRLRRNPVFIPPEARAMLAYDLPMPKADPSREGIEVHVFRRALFPLTPGRYAIGAAQLSYAMPQSPSFFSREEERTLRAEPLTLVAIEPPAAGRPAAWGGAVGRWSVQLRIEAPAPRVGDPFVITMRVAGVGNATLLPRPAIAIPWANVVAEDERVVLDSTPTALAGAKEFAWLVTPRVAGAMRIPPLEFVFFDPAERRYVIALTNEVSVRVRPGDLVSIPARVTAAAADSSLALRPRLAGARPVILPAFTAWGWLALLAPIPWAVATFRRRRPRAARVRSPLERIRDAASAPAGPLRALFAEALRDRTGIRLERETGEDELARALRREGVTPGTAAEAERLRDELDAGAYAGRNRPQDLRDRVRSILLRIAEEARRRSAVLLVVLLPCVGGCAGAEAGDEEALVAFSEGQTAYAGRDYLRARDAFLRATRAAPRDAATWANLGTSAWLAGDTATAVLGWQRALRLDPLAGELRPRLERVRAPQMRGVAYVWPLPVLPVTGVALALWLIAWVLVARRARRRRVGALWLALLPGTLLAGAALAQETRLRARDLVVVATAVPLRALPALGADPGPVPLVGEVVRVRERRGVWLRLDLTAGRAGWYPAERTYPLARD
jgi:tetratricopeptide (TPR) repeat protein